MTELLNQSWSNLPLVGPILACLSGPGRKVTTRQMSLCELDFPPGRGPRRVSLKAPPGHEEHSEPLQLHVALENTGLFNIKYQDAFDWASQIHAGLQLSVTSSV